MAQAAFQHSHYTSAGPDAACHSLEVSRSSERSGMCLNTGYPCTCLTDGNPCEPCKMIAKDQQQQQEEEDLSNNINAVSQADVNPCEPELDISSGEVVQRERGKNWGWMLSGTICVNILILGCALVSGSAYYNIDVSGSDLQVFLIILLLLTSIWMIYYAAHTARKEHAVMYKDGHAGPIWLRGGLLTFGVLGIIMVIFKIASYVGYLHCDSAVKVAFPVVQFVFILVQTYFMWIHAKDCVQLQKNITRCGLMLTLSTNLVLWMTFVTEESLHQTIFPEEPSNYTSKLSGRVMYIQRASYGDDKCKCSHTSCSFFKEAYYYLYPFYIEYSLFASAISYVMWKNVGRVTEEHAHHNVQFRIKDALLGPVAGVLLVIAGLTTFIVYEMEMKKSYYGNRDTVLTMHFVTNIVIVTLMSVSTVIGCAVFRVDHRDHVSDKNPTRNLDVGLLVGASMGQIIISYFTIVAMVGTGAKDYLDRLNLTWSILMVIQLGLQNFFIIEGLHREPFHEVHEELPVSVVSNPYVLEGGKELSLEVADMDAKPSPAVAEPTVHSHIVHSHEHRHKLSWKRRVLKEVCLFLLLGNVILWIMPAFGARPQFDHSTETDFYKIDMWSAVVNVGLPFGIFYRMHSVASLFEVFVTS